MYKRREMYLELIYTVADPGYAISFCVSEGVGPFSFLCLDFICKNFYFSYSFYSEA